MSSINVENLSAGLYADAIKYAKEGTINKNLDKLIDLAAKNGFTPDEKAFLQGLSSEKNIEKLKNITSSLSTLDFIEPGFDFTSKNETKGIPAVAVNIFNQIKTGLSDNLSQGMIETKIYTAEVLDKGIPKDIVKLSNENAKTAFTSLYQKADKTMKADLENLLKSNSNVLMSKDSSGKTTIENLSALSEITINKKTGEKVDGNNLLKNAVNMLKSDKNVTQGYHGTCGAGSLENYIRDKQPSELIRIVKDLASNGKAVLADGKEKLALKLPNNVINYQERGRNQFDRIFQSAVMQNVALFGGDERAAYSKLLVTSKEYNIEKDDGGPDAVKNGDSAADPVLLTHLMNRMFNGTEKFESNTSYLILGNMTNENAVLKGKNFIACYRADGNGDMFGGRHYVMITGQGKDPSNPKDPKTYVFFKNTADPNENKMEISDFLKRLEFTIKEKS
ncbi:MAG: hypothetical protein U0457_15425 [Candidatus Sericytochromatia bacterium]